MATHQHAHQHISMPINIVTKAIEKKKHEISKRTKNSCISYFRVRIKTDASEDKSRNTTKSVVSCKERLQTIYQH